MAAGIPILAADIPALREVLRSGEIGLLFTPRDTSDLGVKLKHLLKNEKLQKEFSRKGYQLVKEKFTWGKVAEKVEGVLKAVSKR